MNENGYLIPSYSWDVIKAVLTQQYESLVAMLNEKQISQLDLIVHASSIYPSYNKENKEQAVFVIYCIDALKQSMGEEFPLKIKISTNRTIRGDMELIYNAERKNKTLVLDVAPTVKDYTKLQTSEPVRLLMKINYSISGELNHPIRDELMKKSGQRLDQFENLLKAHIVSLEESFPQYEDFFYEYESDGKGSWYNLMGRGI